MAEEESKFKFVGDSSSVMDAAASTYGSIAKVGSNLKAVGDTDEKGNQVGKADWVGNTMAAGEAGGKIGDMFGPVGGAIGRGVGMATGAIATAFAKPPSQDEMLTKRAHYDLGTAMQAQRSEDTFAKQQLMAKDGMNVEGAAKQIEVERDEVVLRKVGKQFKKVADFKGGKPHSMGGEQYVASEGDIIFPGKDRKKIEVLMKTKRWRAIESARQNLPTDTGQTKMAKGVKEVDGVDPKRKAKWDKFLAQEGVKEKVKAIAKKHGFTPERLMAVIEYETGGSMSPSQRAGKGKNGKRISSATGLIQFMKATAKDLGTTTDALAKMSALDQLDYVGKYYDKYHKFGDDPYDTVIASSAGSEKDSDILYKKGSPQANKNPSWVDPNGNITKASARKAARNLDGYKGFDTEGIDGADKLPTLEELMTEDTNDDPTPSTVDPDAGELSIELAEILKNNGVKAMVLAAPAVFWKHVLRGTDMSSVKAGDIESRKKNLIKKMKNNNSTDIKNLDLDAVEKEIDNTYVKPAEEVVLQKGATAGKSVELDTEDVEFIKVPTKDRVQSIKRTPTGMVDSNSTNPADELAVTPDYSLEETPFDEGDSKGVGVLAKVGGAFDNLAAYAPAVYNIAKGLERPDKVQRRFVSPQTRKYENNSQVALNAVDEAFDIAMGNARNLSAGSAANFRSNIEKAWADKITRKSQIDAQESSRADAIASENIATRNRADETNVNIAAKADVMDMQSEAVTDSFLQQGLSDIAAISGQKKADAMSEKNQNLMLSMMGTGNFDYVDGKIVHKKSASIPTTSKTTSTPKTVDTKPTAFEYMKPAVQVGNSDYKTPTFDFEEEDQL